MNVDTKIEEFASLRDGTTLVIQRWLPGPVERIWNYLTDSDLRRKWLAAGDMTLTPGAEFELIWRNDELSDASDPRPAGFAEEQRMDSRIIAVEPPRLLTYAWGKGDVTFELEPRGDKVLLTLTHRGLDDPVNARHDRLGLAYASGDPRRAGGGPGCRVLLVRLDQAASDLSGQACLHPLTRSHETKKGAIRPPDRVVTSRITPPRPRALH